MKTKHFLFVFVILGMMIYISCRKVDKIEDALPRPVTESKFFSDHAPLNPIVKSVVEFVKRQNQKYNFTDSLTQRIGFPRWDKALVFKSNTEEGVGTESVGEDIVYIPFVRDNQNFVNASLIVRMTSVDTLFRFLQDWQYEDFGFDEAPLPQEWRAKDVFNIFATFDYAVFGRKKWEIKDRRIFGIEEPTNDSIIVATK